VTYPPEPWSLRGRMHVTVWRLPVAALPPLPPEVLATARVVRCLGHGFVGTAWVDYRPGGVLAYRELLAAVLVREGWRPRVSITHIWVDSVESRDGGRALWGIPKDLAELSIAGDAAAATGIAAAGLGRARVGLRMPVGFRVIQALAGAAKVSPVRSRARCGPARARWTFSPDGPLAFLARGRPLLSLVADDFRMRFGRPARTVVR
jgi:hypothetical protein